VTPERYQRVCDVLHEVLEHPPQERASCLEAACGCDGELRAEVERLLEGHEVAERDGFLDVPSFVIDAIPLELPDFGEYEQIEYLGHGGMGVVYRACHRGFDCQVALKMSLPSHLASEGDAARFRAEARSMARLKHPNIVRVHEIEEYDGRPFFRMELVEGTSLDRQAERYGRNPVAAAQLVETLARAVHHAHQRGVLHRDLKPQNVLLDGEGTPYISDFGLAKRIGQDVELAPTGPRLPGTGATLDSGSSVSRGIVGTAGFMSPEHADPDREETILSDVYGLGAILYAVLTGRPPAQGRTLQERTTWLRDPEQRPVAPGVLNPEVDRDLEAVCLKCLEKDPERRYGSAAEVADDLERWRHGLETRARRWGPMTRALRWCRRQRVAAALLVAVALAAVLAGMVWMQSARHRRLQRQHEAQQIARRQELLSSTGHVARLVASMVRDRLDELARTVEEESRPPELAALCAQGGGPGLDAYIIQLAERHGRGIAGSQFEAWAILATDGTMLAHSLNPEVIGTRFDSRDYFRGAIAEDLARGDTCVHLSRVYESRAQAIFKFGISCVIHGAGQRAAGVLLATVTTDRTMGLPQTVDSRYVPVLMAPREAPIDPAEPPLGEEYVVLFHPAYEHGVDPVSFPAELVDRFERHPLDAAYRDPLGDRDPRYAGRWLAGSAPVPDTSFVVVVQVRGD
jgi:serine/threonine-protein kinase